MLFVTSINTVTGLIQIKSAAVGGVCFAAWRETNAGRVSERLVSLMDDRKHAAHLSVTDVKPGAEQKNTTY